MGSIVRFLQVVLFLLIFLSSSHNAYSQAADPAIKGRLSLAVGTGTQQKVIFPALQLDGGSELTVIAPNRWTETASTLRTMLEQTHRKYSELFGNIPSFTAYLRLMDEETFYMMTGAPSWTNALYTRGQILIPIPADGKIDADELVRSVKHEYTHAVINALSGGRCPGWFDEGLAQWAEGNENPALRPALQHWLSSNDPVPLGLLQNGFTRLDTKMVAAAYAQSLYASRTVVSAFGYKKVRSYLEYLRRGYDKADSFQMSFGMAERTFEETVEAGLLEWSQSEHTRGE